MTLSGFIFQTCRAVFLAAAAYVVIGLVVRTLPDKFEVTPKPCSCVGQTGCREVFFPAGPYGQRESRCVEYEDGTRCCVTPPTRLRQP